MKIAVIVENSSWYGRQIIDGVAAYAQAECDWSLVWSNPRNPSFESRLAGCQGVIARITTDDMARTLRRTGLPVVDVFCAGESADFYGVDSDHETIGRMAADYFVSKRYSTLAFAGFKGVVAHVGLSHVAVGKMFRKKLGMSPQRYINNLKMEAARRLLESDRAFSVKEVSAKLGFSSPAYFCNAYRHRWGRSPRS